MLTIIKDIKGNLWNTTDNKRATMMDLIDYVRFGTDFQVLHENSDEDVTTSVMRDTLVNSERKRKFPPSSEMLRYLFNNGDEPGFSLKEKYRAKRKVG